MTGVEVIAVIGIAVLVGTVLQRLSGTGVGLVVAPVLAIVLGPGIGVLITNMTTVVSGLLIMIAVFPRIDWRRYLLLAPASLLGAVPGAWLVGQLPAGWLSIILGAIVLLALVVTFSLPQLPYLRGRSSGWVAGVVGGFFNTTSGVAAPVMVVYSRVSRWDQGSFAATMQPVFMTFGAVSAVSKLALGSVDTGAVAAGGANGLALGWLFAGIAVTVLVGIAVGGLLSKHVPLTTARTLAMVLAGLGGLGAIVRGTFDVVAG